MLDHQNPGSPRGCYEQSATGPSCFYLVERTPYPPPPPFKVHFVETKIQNSWERLPPPPPPLKKIRGLHYSMRALPDPHRFPSHRQWEEPGGWATREGGGVKASEKKYCCQKSRVRALDRSWNPSLGNMASATSPAPPATIFPSSPKSFLLVSRLRIRSGKKRKQHGEQEKGE